MGDCEWFELSAKAASPDGRNADSGDTFYSSGRNQPWRLQANNGNALCRQSADEQYAAYRPAIGRARP